MTDVFVRAPEDPSEFQHLHAFSHSHHSLGKPFVAEKASHLCRVCVSFLTKLVE